MACQHHGGHGHGQPDCCPSSNNNNGGGVRNGEVNTSGDDEIKDTKQDEDDDDDEEEGCTNSMLGLESDIAVDGHQSLAKRSHQDVFWEHEQ